MLVNVVRTFLVDWDRYLTLPCSDTLCLLGTRAGRYQRSSVAALFSKINSKSRRPRWKPDKWRGRRQNSWIRSGATARYGRGDRQTPVQLANRVRVWICPRCRYRRVQSTTKCWLMLLVLCPLGENMENGGHHAHPAQGHRKGRRSAFADTEGPP